MRVIFWKKTRLIPEIKQCLNSPLAMAKAGQGTCNDDPD